VKRKRETRVVGNRGKIWWAAFKVFRIPHFLYIFYPCIIESGNSVKPVICCRTIMWKIHSGVSFTHEIPSLFLFPFLRIFYARRFFYIDLLYNLLLPLNAGELLCAVFIVFLLAASTFMVRLASNDAPPRRGCTRKIQDQPQKRTV